MLSTKLKLIITGNIVRQEEQKNDNQIKQSTFELNKEGFNVWLFFFFFFVCVCIEKVFFLLTYC